MIKRIMTRIACISIAGIYLLFCLTGCVGTVRFHSGKDYDLTVYNGKIKMEIKSWVKFDRPISVDMSRVLDYVELDERLSEETMPFDLDFMLNCPFTILGNHYSTPFKPAKVTNFHRNQHEVRLDFEVDSGVVELSKLPQDAYNPIVALNIEGTEDFRWHIQSRGSIGFSDSTPNTVSYSLDALMTVETKQQGEWVPAIQHIGHSDASEFEEGILRILNQRWAKEIETKFNLEIDSTKVYWHGGSRY